MNNNFIKVAAFYMFTNLSNLEELKKKFSKFLENENINGTVLLADEGINGTVAGSFAGIENFKNFLSLHKLFLQQNFKTSICKDNPFPRLKVKLKDEIVSLGNELANPGEIVGEYVQPEDWNNLILQDDVLVLDTRNKYEVSIGTFQNAIQPETTNFREFSNWIEDSKISKNKKVAMFCTGGIRCEKASSLMKAKGFKKIFHLQGGILNYMEKVDKENSLWNGECFVFDDRVALTHNLKVGSYDMCHGCRMPITDMDKLDKHYVKGVSCPKCFAKKSLNQKKRYAERQKQIDLAKLRNQKHIGAVSQTRKK
ncbi:rhodanese-related sulfurtransferase [Gammaproteobacteria bacterium]|nr:rhodanese-related sulfurtransferase [Gammaproteobacteria bacterium]